ncbi:flavodoxin domain-containing protein [Streptomyces glaucosporus]|uniref:Flavodoxin domain-containing protein n=1 Tax=Streptomyces glaucosporus TaxID=284044 RepID=A0ABP5W232_9ACTN
MTVLVGYASAHGSTAEIAERIGTLLAGRGHAVEVASLAAVPDTAGYETFVLGSAVHGMAWLPEATAFVEDHRELLASRPVWVFSVGMPAALHGPWKSLTRHEEEKVTGELLAGLHPRGHALFSGVIAPEHLPHSGRAIFKAMGLRYGDYRDWEAVEAFADTVARSLTPAGDS